ncbi:HlyD family secretion protein [Sphingomonas sp.]|uniref:HlyD family secretion protein n=1 Tax=Sphingomonas sp. TaxID=28214 RepID=UPI00307E8DB1
MADADPRIDSTAAADPVAAQKPKRALLRPILMFGVPLVVIAALALWWSLSGGTVSTDNAYVQQDKVSVASDVAGRIVEVAVKENQTVKAGDLLFRIDPEPYRIALAQADAAIANAQVQVTTMQASYAGTDADIQAARDRIAAAQEDYARQKALMDRGFTTRARYEQALHAVEQARAGLQSALAGADEARAKLSSGSAVPGVNPAIAAAQAQRAKALLDLERTARRAPVDGVISQADRLQVGQMMMSGLPAVTIVRSRDAWIEANFKETDLADMRVGQPAEVRFDAYPGLKLKGHVASIGSQTGSETSVLPAQNANGNWVKVTQRVPVRIAIDQQSPRQLIAGLSAEVTVDTRQ